MAFLPPSFVVTVIVAVPAAFAVTKPEDETVATDVLLEDHVTDLSVALDGVTVADNVWVSPTVIVRLVWLRLTPVTAIGFTVTEQVAVFFPSSVVAVMTTVPTFTADTFPFESTVATLELELDQVTFLLVAFEGVTVAVNLSVPPINRDSDVLFNDTPVTDIVLACTVTVQVAFLLPSFVVTVIEAVPAAFAVTTPEDETVATVVLSDDQVTDLSVAFEGVTVAVNGYVSPSVNVNEVLSRLTPVTEIVFAFTVTVHVDVFDPSFILTVIVVVPAAFAVITPEDETVATDVLLDDQVTPFSEAFEGRTDAVNVCVSPSVNVNTEGLIDTDSTATYFPFFPSCSTEILTSSLPARIVSIPSRSYPALASDARFTVHSYSEYLWLSIDWTESQEGASPTLHLDPLTTTILFMSEASDNKSSCVSVVRPVGMTSFSCRFVQESIIATNTDDDRKPDNLIMNRSSGKRVKILTYRSYWKFDEGRIVICCVLTTRWSKVKNIHEPSITVSI